MCFGTVAASEGSVSELRGESQKTPLSHQPSAPPFFFFIQKVSGISVVLQVFQTPEPVSQSQPVAAGQADLPQAPLQSAPVNTQGQSAQTTSPTPPAPAAAPTQVTQHLSFFLLIYEKQQLKM